MSPPSSQLPSTGCADSVQKRVLKNTDRKKDLLMFFACGMEGNGWAAYLQGKGNAFCSNMNCLPCTQLLLQGDGNDLYLAVTDQMNMADTPGRVST